MFVPDALEKVVVESVVWPATWRKPERVLFVPEAFVKFNVGNVP